MIFVPCGQAAARVPQADIPVSPRFAIVRFDVDGITLLKPEEIERSVAPYRGKDIVEGNRYFNKANVRVDFAQVVDPAGNQGWGDQMLQASVAIPF